MAKRIVIFSAKGGVGKTLIATNLAVSLAKDQSKRVCLLDLDLQVVGDMAMMLNLKPEKAMADAINLIKIQPESFKKDDFLKHSSSGVDFLAGVLMPEQSAYLEPEDIGGLISLLDKDYDYIIIDGGNSLNDILVAALDQANLILLVVTPDALSIYQTKWVLDTLQLLRFPLSMMRVVLSRAESASSISWQEVRFALPVAILSRIPSEGKVAGQAVNRGIPLVIYSPKSHITQAINKLSQDLVSQESDLFIEHLPIDKLMPKEIKLEKAGSFWQEYELTEPLIEPLISEKTDAITALKRRTYNRLIQDLNLKRMDVKAFSDPKKTKELKDKAEKIVINVLTKEAGAFISSYEMRQRLVKEVLDEALGLGPLEEFLADPSITDIMVNNKDEIYIEREGKIILTGRKFISNEQVRTIIERIIAPIGRHIDESTPMVDARLPDGSRINAIIPPLSLTGPSLTIRKFRKERFKISELVGMNTLSSEMARFLEACVLSRKNMVVSGGTGSGKTTTLNVLSAFISSNERIVTIEDAAELKLNQEHWVRLEARPANIEGKGAITIRDLFRNTLRMRPDRIIIGECRGIETLDMLQAMNTGHDGSMTTIHANSTQDVLSRLDSMILMSGFELPIRAIREMIASAINLIIHTARLSDGRRKIVQITEIAGMKDEVHINLKDVFVFKQTGTDSQGNVLGEFRATGYLPSFLEDIKIRNIKLSEDIFKPSTV